MNELTPIKTDELVDEWDFPIDTCDLHTMTNFSVVDVPPSMARCIVRTDTNEVLGVHGSKYKAIKHDDVVNSVFDAVNRSGISKDYDHKIEIFDNGAKMRGIINFNDLVIVPAIDDHITFQVKFFNSYDGSWAFQQQAVGIRMWCINTCTTADTVANTWAKHTTNVNVEGSAAKIQAGLDAFFNTKDQYQQWMQTSTNDSFVETFFKHVVCRTPNKTSTIKWNERQLDTLMSHWYTEKKQLGSNKWALYNALTAWATHTNESKSPANTQRLRENQLAKVFKHSSWHTALVGECV